MTPLAHVDEGLTNAVVAQALVVRGALTKPKDDYRRAARARFTTERSPAGLAHPTHQ